MSKNRKQVGLKKSEVRPEYYINRELSQLEFQRRVLEEAKDKSNPLLERVKFLAIVGSNLDEFFMVRVGGLCSQVDEGIAESIEEGEAPPKEQLAAIRKVASALMQETADYLRNDLMPELAQAGIHIYDYADLNVAQRQKANDIFNEVIFPVLTPLAFDPGHPFPHISNLSLNLAVLVEGDGEEPRFARVKIPESIPYLMILQSPNAENQADAEVREEFNFVWTSQVIIANLPMLFPGIKVLDAHPFHVTRNADMELGEYQTDDDLLEIMEESVRRRRFGSVVRLLVRPGLPERIQKILIENLNIDANDVYWVRGPLNLRNLMQLTRINRPDLKYKPFVPVIPILLRPVPNQTDNSIFAAIRRGNILLHHPYDSFNPVVDFLREAAQDPNVLTIKQTLYRVGNNSPVVRTLLQAARDYGKQVAVLVELKARFDEESNIGWAKLLEQEGVHVTYGLPGLKTHSKIALVVRKEGDHIRRYLHLATGNYNHITAQLYEDVGMFTCDDAIGADATDLFNYLTGYSLKEDYRKLLVAPLNLRERMEELIRQEIVHQQAGKGGYIIFKANAIVDKPIIDLLYQASQAGVKIDLIVRGACSLRPGIPGLSENIRVISILGRFLEHSRIYYFRNGGKDKMLLGSADLMPRNLNQRVEVLFPVEEPAMVTHIRRNILGMYLADNTKARIMQSDGTCQRLHPGEGEKPVNVQEWFIDHSK
jgi:polyphosphate kinase